MADVWGSYAVGTSGRQFRIGVTIEVMAEDAIGKTLRAHGYFQGSGGVSDSSNSFVVGGGAFSRSGSVALSIVGTPEVEIWTQDISIFKTYGAEQTITISASLNGLDYYGTGTTASLPAGIYHTIAARPYDAPAAPTGVTVARNSDTQHTVTWACNPATAAPYTSQDVYRWDNVTAAFVAVVTGLPGAQTSFVDWTTVANRAYTYLVVANNSAGSTASAASTAVQTTPGAPASVAAAKSGANVVVTWVDGHTSGMLCTVEVWESAGGGAYSLLATVAAGAQSYTHTSPSTGVTHQYQTRTKSTVGTTLYSGFVTSNLVQLSTSPNAPTGLAPSGVAVDASEAQTLTWVHSSADTAPQSKFQIRHRLVGAGSWTTITAVVSPVSTWTLPPATYANGTQFEWQVCTWGVHATASAFSATATVQTSTRPTVVISAPSTTVNVSTLTLVWGYYDAESTAQAEWQAELTNSVGTLVEAKSGVGTALTTTFTAKVATASTYTVRIRVRDGSGLWSTWTSRTFTVTYLPPAAVAVTATYNAASASVVLSFIPAASVAGVTVPQASLTVRRRVDGGALVVIAEGVAPSASLVDVAPTIHGVNVYQVTVLSALPSSAVMAEVSVTTAETRWVFLSGGTSLATVLKVRANVRHTTGADEELQQFADREKPVLLSSIATQDGVSVSGVIDSEASRPTDFHALQKTPGVKLLRAPSGLRLFGKLSGMATEEDNPRLTPVSFNMTESDRIG